MKQVTIIKDVATNLLFFSFFLNQNSENLIGEESKGRLDPHQNSFSLCYASSSLRLSLQCNLVLGSEFISRQTFCHRVV